MGGLAPPCTGSNGVHAVTEALRCFCWHATWNTPLVCCRLHVANGTVDERRSSSIHDRAILSIAAFRDAATVAISWKLDVANMRSQIEGSGAHANRVFCCHYHTKMVLSDAWEAEPLQITEAFIPTFESPPLLPKELSCSKLRNAALLAHALEDASHTSAEHMTATPSHSFASDPAHPCAHELSVYCMHQCSELILLRNTRLLDFRLPASARLAPSFRLQASACLAPHSGPLFQVHCKQRRSPASDVSV